MMTGSSCSCGSRTGRPRKRSDTETYENTIGQRRGFEEEKLQRVRGNEGWRRKVRAAPPARHMYLDAAYRVF